MFVFPQLERTTSLGRCYMRGAIKSRVACCCIGRNPSCQTVSSWCTRSSFIWEMRCVLEITWPGLRSVVTSHVASYLLSAETCLRYQHIRKATDGVVVECRTVMIYTQWRAEKRKNICVCVFQEINESRKTLTTFINDLTLLKCVWHFQNAQLDWSSYQDNPSVDFGL